MKDKIFLLISIGVCILLLTSNGNAMHESGIDQPIYSNQAKVDLLQGLRIFSPRATS